MKKFIIAAALGATVLTGGAIAAVAQDASTAQSGPQRGMRADTDKDGVVTKAEALAQAEKRFAKVDANNDGRITREERKAARADKPGRWGKHRGGHGRGMMQGKMLERFDADKDGKLSDAERTAARATMQQHRGEMRAKMLERFDADKDGKLSASERQAARAAMKEMRDNRAAPSATPQAE